MMEICWKGEIRVFVALGGVEMRCVDAGCSRWAVCSDVCCADSVPYFP